MINLFNLNWNIFILSLLILLTSMAVTRIMKLVNVRLSKSMNWAKGKTEVEYKDVKNKGYAYTIRTWINNLILRLRLVEKTRLKLLKAGETRAFMITTFFIMQYIIPLAVFLGMYLNERVFIKALMVALLFYLIAEFVYQGARSSHERIFRYNVYKIYKFISYQLSAGVKLNDALMNMYKIVDDKFLKKRLFFLSSENYLTNDLDKAFEYLNESYSVDEANSLYQAIKQGINAGSNHELFEKKEKSMFNKYVLHIEAETAGQRTKAVLAALCYGLVIVMLLAYPLVRDVIKAMNTLF